MAGFPAQLSAKRHLGRLMLMVAATSVLAMPVSYTGGRDVSHPHAFVQLIIDATSGSTSHHQPSDGHGHAERPERSIVLTGMPDDTPIVTRGGGAMERVALVGAVLGMGFLLILGGQPAVLSMRRVLVGLAVGPEVPPPRIVAAA